MPRSTHTVPNWLGHVHRRSQRVGTGRVAVEAGMLSGMGCVLVVLAAAALGWQAPALVVAGTFALAFGLASGFLVTVLPMVNELATARTRMRRLATHDTATGIANRRHFSTLLQREWERCRRYRSGANVVVIEIDHLVAIEHEHGRAARDAVMRAVALACDGTLRKPDLLGHHGGNVLAAFLPHTETLGAVDVAERLRGLVAESAVPWHKTPIRVTLSIGVAALGDAQPSLAALMAEAESALQAAQRAGRNCVRVSPSRGSRSSNRDYPVMG